MPKVFTSSKERPTTKIWRVQHVTGGHGPFVGSDNDEVDSIVRNSNLPSPQSDSKSWSKEDLHHLNDPTVPKKFGFETREQMHATFSPEKLKILKKYGYEPVQIDASHVWGGDGKQIFYSTPHADKKLAEFEQKTKVKRFSPEEIAAMGYNVKKSVNTDRLRKKLCELKKTISIFYDSKL
jgi:hypothetical protein